MRRICLFAFLMIFAAACASTPEPTATPTETPLPTLTPTATLPPEPTPLPSVQELTRATDPSQQAFLSVVHAAAGAPIFDIYVERLAIAANLNFGGSTQPSGIVAGDYFLRVVPNGVRPDAGEVLYETQLSLEGGDSLLLLFTGSVDNLSMAYFPQPLDPLEANQSRVTVIHAIPDGPPLTMQQNGADLTVPMSFGNAAFPVVLPAGETTLDFAVDGVNRLSYPINLREQFSYVLVIAGDAASIENATIIQTRNSVPGLVQIRAVHASPDIGPVDIFLNDEPLATNLEYTRASDRQPRAAQVYQVDVFAPGVDRRAVEPLLRSQVIANSGESLSIILIGSTQRLQLLPYREDTSPTVPDEARIAFINTIEQAPRVRIDLQYRVLMEAGELGYGQPPSVVDLPAIVHRFSILEVENGSPSELVELAEDVQLEAGRSYLYLITGRINDPPVILSENLGINEAFIDTEDSDAPLTPTPEIPTSIRFINAVNGGLPLDVLVDGQSFASNLTYGQSSTVSMIGSGDHTLEVRQVNNGQSVLSFDTPLEVSTPYTVVLFGFGTEVEYLLLDDSERITEGDAPLVRLINLTTFGEFTAALAESRAETVTDGPTIFSESPGSENFRRSMAFGVDRLRTVTEVEGRVSSNVGLAPLGPHDLHIIDVGINMIAASIRGVDFSPGAYYDVLIYQNRDSAQVEGFAVRYPAG
ncbi:MAG: hypothetical protein CL610_10500 [Anaerolineaceae bacterium]|nr:hypothetical protein [Anaerolineaceae bacterium]